ncbi:MAG: PIN domain-containing protein [Pseudomonadales bacterium]
MIYLDTSVALAHLLAEDQRPKDTIWSETLITSRLLEYELYTRLHAKGLTDSHGQAALAILERLAFLALSPPVLARALEPFPTPVSTLDALHLASAEFLRASGQPVALATYDQRMQTAAKALGLPLVELD